MISDFGRLPDGRNVSRIELRNNECSVGLLTYGASMQSVHFGECPVLLGSDDLSDYLGPLKYFGAIVGRVANRIARARALIAGEIYEFDANEANGNCLHGGADGAGQLLWTLYEHSREHAVMGLTLPDGHMGFPGCMRAQVRYSLHASTLRVELTAETDRETLCGFAPHGYWNLSGEPDINAHDMQIAAQQYLPLDARSVPTGDIAPVAGTEFDFTNKRKLAQTSLDHNFCTSSERQTLRPVLWLGSDHSGIELQVASTEAGVQVYDGRHMGRCGLAIEPQVWPDAINHKGFPSMVLKPGETYQAITEFRLSKRAHS